MITLKKLNVVRVVASDEEAAKLEAKGFKRTVPDAAEGAELPAKPQKPGKKPPAGKEDTPDGTGSDQ